MFGLEFLIFSLVFVAVASIVTPSSSAGSSSKKPSLNDFDFTTNSNSRTVPVLFGKAKFSGNLLVRGKLVSKPILEKSGGKKSSSFEVGRKQNLSFAISWCKSITNVHELYLNNKKLNNFKTLTRDYIQLNGISTAIQCQTGINRESHGSNTGKNNCLFYNGSQVQNYNNNPSDDVVHPDLVSLMGKGISFKNTRYTFFNNSYIGDNVQRLPEYKIVCSNTGLTDVDLIFEINNAISDGKENVDPFYILRYIFFVFLGKEVKDTPWQNGGDLYYSQEDWNYLINEEKLFLSFLMTSEKSVKDWVNELLRHIDATIFYNFYLNRYEIKLIRNNYDLNDSIIIDESNYMKLKIIKKEYKDIKSKITINYTHPENFNVTSISWTNEANLPNNINEETYDYNMIRDHEYAKQVLKRLIKKECYPTTSFKFSLPAEIVEGQNDYNIKPGDVLNFNNKDIGLSDFPIRILSMSGGKEEELEYDFIRTEENYNTSSFSSLDFEVNKETPFNYELNDLDNNNIKIIDTPAEMTSLNNDSLITLVVEDETDEELVNGYIRQDGLTGSRLTINNKRSYREVKESFTTDLRRFERNVDLIVHNTINMKEINGSDINFQRMKYSGIFEDGEFFCLRSITDNLDGSYTISGLIRGLSNTNISNKNIGTKLYLMLDGTTANTFVSLNIVPSINKIIYFNKFNNANVGNKVSKLHTYNNTVKKPYSPRNIKSVINGSNTDISWGATRRLRGRNYRSPEIIVAGEDEGTNEEGIKYIITHGSNIYETTNLNISIPHITGSFTIKSNIGRYFSNEETINII